MSDEEARLAELQKVFQKHSNRKLKKKNVQVLSDILDDLSSRFLLNLPQDELTSFERICFAIENAHWFYEDYYCEEHTFLPSMGYRSFAAVIFHHCPLLQPYHHHLSDIMTGFSEYKAKIPTRGAILLDPTLKECLIVKGWGSRGSWMFPKGKIDEGESDVDCAIREVDEEIGFDISPFVIEKHVIRGVIGGKEMRLFIIAGVSKDTVFETRTRKEISQIRWFPVADLPSYGQSKSVHGISAKKMFTIAAVANKLRSWIKSNKKRIRKLIRQHGAVYSPSYLAEHGTPPPQAQAGSSSSSSRQQSQQQQARQGKGRKDSGNAFLSFTFDVPAVMEAVSTSLVTSSSS